MTDDSSKELTDAERAEIDASVMAANKASKSLDKEKDVDTAEKFKYSVMTQDAIITGQTLDDGSVCLPIGHEVELTEEEAQKYQDRGVALSRVD